MVNFHKIERKRKLKEDAGPTNTAGGGQVAGIGVANPNVPNQEEPGGIAYKKRKPLRGIISRMYLVDKKGK